MIPKPIGGWRIGTVVDCAECGRRLAEIISVEKGEPPKLKANQKFMRTRRCKCGSTNLKITVPARNVTMTPQQIRAKHGGVPLTGAIQNLPPTQQLEIARTAFEHGIIETANVLEVDAGELTACMVEWGYGQCPGCDEWKPVEELTQTEGVEANGEEPPLCENCRG